MGAGGDIVRWVPIILPHPGLELNAGDLLLPFFHRLDGLWKRGHHSCLAGGRELFRKLGWDVAMVESVSQLGRGPLENGLHAIQVSNLVSAGPRSVEFHLRVPHKALLIVDLLRVLVLPPHRVQHTPPWVPRPPRDPHVVRRHPLRRPRQFHRVRQPGLVVRVLHGAVVGREGVELVPLRHDGGGVEGAVPRWRGVVEAGGPVEVVAAVDEGLADGLDTALV
mmetsp:Transcript_28505/g.62896  ORF Transcript_28505/g.62896 Transcript_28505/m.62896 type:complete len:222 (-) Transcript_28505:250-915(-)